MRVGSESLESNAPDPDGDVGGGGGVTTTVTTDARSSSAPQPVHRPEPAGVATPHRGQFMKGIGASRAP